MRGNQSGEFYEAGKAAALAGVAATECPHAYAAVGYPPQDEFDRIHRPRLDDWMRGWIDHHQPKPGRRWTAERRAAYLRSRTSGKEE